MASEAFAATSGKITADRWFYVGWILVSIWILACALLVNGEYGDGYQTIVNARYLFGDSPHYYVQRGPLAAIALFPVEVLINLFQIKPLEVWPYHIYSGLLHSVYLLGCWLLLKRMGPATYAHVAAFVAAILSVVFYAFAPYLSHDILPGFLFLVLIFICNRWLSNPTAHDAAWLIFIGTGVTFIKQTYALFWVALVIYALLAFALKWDGGRVGGRKLLTLFALAAVSAALSWIGYGLFIAGKLPNVPMFVRPWVLINAVSVQYGSDFTNIFSADIYLRNAHNYGIAALLLVVPGLVRALRGQDGRLRMFASCWIVGVVFMQMIGYREVRYLAFLAPLTASLILPIMQLALQKRALAFAIVAVVVFDQYRGISLAADEIGSTATINVERFIRAAPGSGRIVASRVLSFVYDAKSPFLRDPYHGIYHLTAEHLRALHEGKIEVVELDDPRELGSSGILPGDRVYFSNDTMIRKAPWTSDNSPNGLPNFIQISGNASSIELIRNSNRYIAAGHDADYVMLIPGQKSGQQMPLVSASGFATSELGPLYGDSVGADRLTVTGVVIGALCQGDTCRYR